MLLKIIEHLGNAWKLQTWKIIQRSNTNIIILSDDNVKYLKKIDDFSRNKMSSYITKDERKFSRQDYPSEHYRNDDKWHPIQFKCSTIVFWFKNQNDWAPDVPRTRRERMIKVSQKFLRKEFNIRSNYDFSYPQNCIYLVQLKNVHNFH